MGYIVFVTDKHRGEQTEMTIEEVKNFPIFEYAGENPVAHLEQSENHETLGNIIRIEPSDEMIKGQIEHYKGVIHKQQEHIMRLEKALAEKGVSHGDISAIQKGNDS